MTSHFDLPTYAEIERALYKALERHAQRTLQDVLIEALYVDANGPSKAGAGKWDVSFVILPEELEVPFARACAEVQEAHPTALAS